MSDSTTWQDRYLIHLGPGILGGITFEDWLRLLAENRFSIDPPYWGRALTITLQSLVNSLVARRERARFEKQIDATEIQPPVFVLGMWRSGTTHLQNLLSQDARFAFPNYFQSLFPHTFLLMEQRSAKMADALAPKKRPLDNVRLGMDQPCEDEMALCALVQRSFMLSLVFPRRADFYDRYLTFREADQNDLHRWKQAFHWFVRKLTYKHGRPLVLKSPGHTCRIKLLLELFPDARFVHIHRHPYDVYVSAKRSASRLVPYWALQRVDLNAVADTVFESNTEFYTAFFEERPLIPVGQFHELAFEDLERDPVAELQKTYTALDLPDFHVVEPRLREYLASLAGYQKNAMSVLPPEDRQRIQIAWPWCFDQWGYSREPAAQAIS
ncbi:MAG: sulfotransferase [Pirellulaceae bacterium]